MRDFCKIFLFLKKYIAKYKWSLTLYVLLAIFFSLTEMALPYIVGVFVDRITTAPSLPLIITCSALFIAISAAVIGSTFFVKIVGTRLVIRVATSIKVQFLLHYQKVSPLERVKEDAAGMANKINNDVEYLVMLLINTGQQFPGQLLCLLLGIGYTFSISVWLGVAALAELPVMYVLLKLFGDRISTRYFAYQEARTGFFSALNEQIEQIDSIRMHGIFDIMSRRFFQSGRILEKTSVSNEKVSFLYGMINENMDILFKIVLFLYGGFSMMQGTLTIGSFTILYSYLGVLTAAYAYFLSFHQQVQQYMTFYSRLKQIEAMPQEQNGSELLRNMQEIQIKNMTFSYGEREIFKNYSNHFSKGKLYCFVGENGAGKSTLAKILLGLYVNQTGEQVSYSWERLNESAYSTIAASTHRSAQMSARSSAQMEIKMTALDMYEMRRSRIGVSEQEPVMLEDTVGFNMMYGDITERDKKKIAELLKMLSFYNKDYPESDLEKLLAADAITLSGGQKQKISIVKAIIKNPQLLILDEPTSAMDEQSRHAFANYLQTFRQERIVIVISHDREMIDSADEVVRIGE